MEILFVIGRILLAGFFLLNAYRHLFKYDSLAGYAQSKGVRMAKFAVIGSGILLLVGAYSILTGMHVEAGVAALALFLIPTSFTMHAFWKESDPGKKAMEQIQFTKNMALLGAVLMLLAIPLPWPGSFGGF